MASVFEYRLVVRSNELGDDDTVNHSSIVQWFQESAFQASEANGFGSDYYARTGSTWLVRGLEVEFAAEARYRDEIIVSTWVSEMRRVRSRREYHARRERDGKSIAVGRADWVYLDNEQLVLKRIDAEMQSQFEPYNLTMVPAIDWLEASNNPNSEVFASSRRVQFYEHDSLHHVNNTVYVAWLEQQMVDAWQEWGHDLNLMKIRRHSIEYLRQSQFGQTLQLSSQAVRRDGHDFWSHRIALGEATIVKARSLSETPPSELSKT